MLRAFVIGVMVWFSFGQASRVQPDPPAVCGDCDAWNAPQEAFRIFGNTYYVGRGGVSAILITSPQGLILVDGGLQQSAVPIDESIRAVGFRTEDVKLIVNSHAHFDHAGGIAALQRATGAVVAASPAGAQALQQGAATKDDPQYDFHQTFPKVERVRAVADGEVLRVGDLAITAHHTPGHTPGSTAWTWRSCEGSRCVDLVYADSLTPVAAPAFRYTGTATYASRVESSRRSIATVAALPCDILLTPHPSVFDLAGKLKKRAQQPGTNPFIDGNGCRALAATATKAFDARIASEGK